MQTTFQQVVAKQGEIYQAVTMSNYLAVAGRLLEIAIGVMLALVLVRLEEICRKRDAR